MQKYNAKRLILGNELLVEEELPRHNARVTMEVMEMEAVQSGSLFHALRVFLRSRVCLF